MTVNIYIRFTSPFLQCSTHHTPNTSRFLYHTLSLVGKPEILHVPLFGRAVSFLWQYGQAHWSQPFLWVQFESCSRHTCRKMQSHLQYVLAQFNRVVANIYIYVWLFYASTWTTENITEGLWGFFLWLLMGYSVFKKKPDNWGRLWTNLGYKLVL